MDPIELEIRKFFTPAGVLRPYLIRGGFPLIIPNLWIDELSLSSRTNTLEAYIRDIAILYRWGSKQGVSIEDRLKSLQGFLSPEIRNIAHTLCRTSAGELASQSTCRRRLESLRSFLSFAFDYYVEMGRISLIEQIQAEKNRTRQINQFAKQIAFAANASKHPMPSTDLSPAEVEIVDAIIHPASELNPFRDSKVRFRNYCMFRVLLETLARRGELALMEITDVQLGHRPTITIKEPNITEKYRRRDGASLKTLGRMVPISESLANILSHYIDDVRDDFLQPGRPSKALFLSARDGRRVSTYTINQILNQVEAVPEVAAMNKRIHPHGLRATAANEVRRKVSQAGQSSMVDLQECLSYLGGWVQGSSMVQLYTRSAINERLGEILRTKINASERKV